MSTVTEVEREKRAVAETAAQLVESGMTVGLGTGSTVAYLLPALAARRLAVRCVTSSPATERAARELGMEVEAFSGPGAPARVDLTIDGADQVAPSGWLVKGGGAAHTREKALAAAAERFVVIVSSNKLVRRPSPPIPLELLEYGLAATLARLGQARLRDAPRSPDGGVIADYLGDVDAPDALALWLSSTTGVVEHGLFAPALVPEVLVAPRPPSRSDHRGHEPVMFRTGVRAGHIDRSCDRSERSLGACSGTPIARSSGAVEARRGAWIVPNMNRPPYEHPAATTATTNLVHPAATRTGCGSAVTSRQIRRSTFAPQWIG